MFDAQNDRRQEPFEDKPKASLADAKFKPLLLLSPCC